VIEATAHLFEYDVSRPLDVRTIGSERRDGVAVTEIRFAAARGGQVDAFVVEPAGAKGARAGVVYAHGGRGPGKHLFVSQAVELARAGMTVLLADTSLPPPGDIDVDERALADAVLVQRRALDVLAEVGADWFGYFGHSFGGAHGAILSAVEPRLEAIVIAAMGTGVVEWLRADGYTDEHYLERIERLDPIHYVTVSGRRRLLFQHGRADAAIPLAAGRALFEAAAPPKQWSEHDCDHGIDAHPPALAERIAFLQEVLHG
jgi:dipeptidyl aminopeptidase/acylaminoacyl peptidase